jgi:hypothetical protein
MRESYIEAHFCKTAKANRMKTIKLLPNYEVGIPDRMLMYMGLAGFVELKAPNKTPRKVQELYLKRLKEADFFTAVVDSKRSAEEVIAQFKSFVHSRTAQWD